MKYGIDGTETFRALVAAIEGDGSKISEEVGAIGGFTSRPIRNLMNRIGAFVVNGYLEVGVHRGSIFFATLDGNPNIKTALACDNFSQFNTDGAEEEFKRHLAKEPRATLYERDCFEITGLPVKPDLYFYDGDHGYESQKKAITHFAPMLAETFILCVDDHDWDDVSNGTKDGLKEAGITVVKDWVFLGKDGYHNGFYVALCSKNK
jgi:hypothetical protein